jgi:hypothetical protein
MVMACTEIPVALATVGSKCTRRLVDATEASSSRD